MAEEKKPKGEKKPKVKKVVEKEKGEKPTTKQEPKLEENKSKDGDVKNDSKEEQSSPPPPPPEIVLRVFMHCEGCARKVRKCLKGFDGIEDVTTDCKTHKVVVKGEKADPLKVLDRLQKKTHRQVDLLSPVPQPKPPAEEANKKPMDKEPPKKQEEKKEEPKVVSVVLKVHMHCEPCSLEIKRRIERMKEVEEAIPDIKNSQVTVKGTFDPQKLVEHVYKRTGKQATIVEKDPPQEKKKDDNKGKDNVKEKKKAEKKVDEGKKVEEKEAPPEEKQKEETPGSAEGGDGNKAAVVDEGGPKTKVEEGPRAVELTRNEFQYYPPTYAVEMYSYPPQIFSDENPNACSVM